MIPPAQPNPVSPHTDSVQAFWQSEHSAAFFVKLAIWASVIFLAYSLARWFIDGGLAHAVGPLIISATGVVAWYVRRRQRVFASFLIYVWGVWLALSAQLLMQAGIANASMHGYLLLMVATGWMMGIRHVVIVGLASIAYILILAFAMQHGGWRPGPSLGPVGQALSIVTIWSVALILIAWIIRAQHRQLEATRRLNATLARMVADGEQKNRALLASEQRFATIIQASPLPIAISRVSDGLYLDVNPAWEREMGWSRAEAISNTSVGIGFWSSTEQRNAWIEQFARDGRSLGVELDIRTRAGTDRTALLSAELIDYGDDKAVLSLFVDVTERQRVAAELQALNLELEQRVGRRTAELARSNEELTAAMVSLTRAQEELAHSEKLASLGQLVAGVAHELNTPIGNALTASTTVNDAASAFRQRVAGATLRRSELLEFVAQVDDGARLIARSLYRAAELLSSFKQVAVDQASERRRTFDLGLVTRELVDTLRPTLKGQPWVIDVQIGDGVTMESFPGSIDQILINMVLNATIHAFAGRASGRIVLSVENLDEQSLDLVCTDDGIGIPAENLGRIFDPFFTSRLGQGGSGLGLAITHRLATQVLGGQVSVDSEIGKGTRFVLHLPRRAPEVVA